ncbi:MAG TPA: hypothetical protein VKV23_08230 [Acidimicrobiales bacterium]|nr:hypothetical protein [Acidimicrobiales bacterium]
MPGAAEARAERLAALRDDIAANRVPGGSAFARASAELIALSVEEVDPSAGVEAVREAAAQAADWVASTKPSMAVVRNVARLAASLASGEHADASALREEIAIAMRAFAARSEQAVGRIGALAPSVVRAGARVLVHSYSATLEALLRSATAAGIPFELLVTESRPYRESRRLVEALAAAPVPVVLYSDAAVCIAAERADVALVGADTVFADGSFANKTGTLPLALACRRAGVDLYVATELAKVYLGDERDIEMEVRPAAELAEGWPLVERGRVAVWNQFFERVDAGLVHRYVTEEGVHPPERVAELARDLLDGWAAERGGTAVR